MEVAAVFKTNLFRAFLLVAFCAGMAGAQEDTV